MMNPIQIQTFGSFAVEHNGTVISDTNTRSRKVWSLLAYLVCNRGRVISQKTLIDLLWGADADSENPENALRITLHRLRGLLDRLWPGAGRELILHKDGGYCWSEEHPPVVDYERFEAMILQEASDDEARLKGYLDALKLYHGEFLPKHSSEFWVIPLSTHFHNLFLQVSMEAGHMLLLQGRYDEALTICRRAASTEPYHEPLHRLLLSVLGAKGDTAGAAKVFEDLSRRLSEDFGIQPNEETKEVFRQATRPREERSVSMERVLEQLQEETTDPGALLCEYGEFKTLCRARSRVMERSGDETHVAQLSLIVPKDANMPKGILPKLMDDMEQLLKRNLRRGDVISRCSGSQFIVMLVDANYENSCMVCRRLVAAFTAANAGTPIKINFMVQPLNTNLNMP